MKNGKRVAIGARPPANPHADAWLRYERHAADACIAGGAARSSYRRLCSAVCAWSPTTTARYAGSSWFCRRVRRLMRSTVSLAVLSVASYWRVVPAQCDESGVV